MQVSTTMPVLVLEGSPRERGRIHGEALRTQISEYVDFWQNHLQESTGIKPDAYIDGFLEATDLLAAVKKWTPDLLEEVSGIAEGSGFDFKTIFSLQLPDEEWWYRLEQGFNVFGPGGEHCSSIGVYGQIDQPPIVAQNMDGPGYFDEYQVLLHIKDHTSPLESFVFTTAGFIALNGVNNQGVCICCNALLQLNHAKDGLPVAFVHRGVLAQSNLDDAIEFIHRVRHASGQNYIVGGPHKVFSYECSANKVSQFVPYKGATRLYHTNHPLANDDLIKRKESQVESPAGKKKMSRGPSNSEIRYQSLEIRLKDTGEPVTVETIQSILASHDSPEHPVCRHKKPRGEIMTVGSLVMVLSTPPVLHLAPGPPCMTEFRTFTF